ncbi:MADS-box transcription factor 23 [Triticum aestivum]|uniref:MADS-box transcription factor 23 n=1 Tax=Triticum aestivum TaxID=4565 RepID=UPI001D00A1B4|nr:MADS-box transcription factor 23-like [Triticum aestivum]
MVRRKTVIERIEDTTSRQVTFSKRKGGLFKKARELGVLCDAQVGILLFSNTGRLYEYSNSTSGVNSIIERYQKVKEGQQFMSASAEAKMLWMRAGEWEQAIMHDGVRSSNEATGTMKIDEVAMCGECSRVKNRDALVARRLTQLWKVEANRLRQQLHNLQEDHRQLLGQNLPGLGLEGLKDLENQLETSIHNIRLTKDQLMIDEIEELNKKESLVHQENTELYKKLNIIRRQNLDLQNKLNGQVEVNETITSSSSQYNIAARADPVCLQVSHPHHAERDEQPESPTLWYGKVYIFSNLLCL